MDRLRYWRQQRGLSQVKLARMMKSTQRAISAVEAGTASPTVRWLERAAGALGIAIRDFFPPKPARKPRGH